MAAFTVFCRRLCHTVAQSGANRWHLASAAYVQRPAVISSPRNELEEKYAQLSARLEIERSLQSDHEQRHQEDLRVAERVKSGRESGISDDAETGSFQTAQDVEDACAEELARFHVAERRSAADVTGDQTQITRALDQRLFLLVHQRIAPNINEWILPQTIHADGETMLQAAKRAIVNVCGTEMEVKFLGNAPCGFYRYRYPNKMVKDGEPVGAKVFFFPARLVRGNVSVAEGSTEFLWLTREEIMEKLRVQAYRQAVSSFIVDDNFDRYWVSTVKAKEEVQGHVPIRVSNK